MITDEHKQAIQELLKMVQSKMGGMGDEGPEGTMSEMGDVPESQSEETMPEDDELLEAGVGEEENPNGLDPSIIADMKQKFSGREDLSMPAGKKGMRIGMTEVSAIPMKKPMRR